MRARAAGVIVALVSLAVASAACTVDEPSGAPGPDASTTTPAPATTRSHPPSTRPTTTRPRPTAHPPRTPTECARRLVTRMDLRTRAAQLLMVGVESTSVEPPAAVSSAVAELGVGAVILTGRDPVAATSVRGLVDGLQQAAERSPAGVRLEVSTDQEGGQVQALAGEGFASMPSALVQGTSSPRALRRDAAQWGRELAAAGVTLDLAPVADVVPPGTSNAPIGDYDREFGRSVDAVAPAVRAFVRGMDAAGVASTIKHFPGLGRATGNTDTTAGVVDDLTTRHDPFLRPFVVGIEAGAPYVMMSTATYRRLDGDHIAAYSTDDHRRHAPRRHRLRRSGDQRRRRHRRERGRRPGRSARRPVRGGRR